MRNKKAIKSQRQLANVLSVFLLVAGIGAFLYLTTQYTFTQDDTYISIRYVLNYLNGDGLVFNIGERVEGYTNFLWILFLILGGLLKADPVSLAGMLGLIFGCGTILITYLIGLQFVNKPGNFDHRVIAGASAFIVGATYSYAYWSVSGMETACFTFMTTLSVYLYITRNRLLPCALVLATLTRPEGALVFAIIVLYDVVLTRSISIYVKTTISLYAVFLIPFAVFKLMYYGYLLPNTFYAKTAFSIEQLKNGLSYTGLFFWHYLGAGVFILPAIIFFRKLGKSGQAILLFFVLYTLYIIFIGGDVLKVHRFFMPLMPLAAVITVVGFYWLWQRKLIIFVVLVVVLVWQFQLPRKHANLFYRQEQGLILKMSIMMDKLLVIDRSNFSVAASTIGVVGYKLIGHQVIDILGLTDSTIARHPEEPITGITSTWREASVNSAYILSRQPDYILFSTGLKPSAPAERSLFLHSSFWHSYRTIPFRGIRSLYSIFKRYHDVPLPAERNIPVDFVENYTEGVNRLWRDKDYRTSLVYFNRASSYYPGHENPYIYYYRGLNYMYLNVLDSCRMEYETLLEKDTLTYEGYKNLYMYTYMNREFDTAMYYRRKLVQLAPWFVPSVDSMAQGLL